MNLLLTLFLMFGTSQAKGMDDFGLKISPYVQYIISGSVGTQSRTTGTGKVPGDGYGFGLGTRIGGSFNGFEGGLDLHHLQLGTKSETNSFIVSGETITARSFGIYGGYRYENVFGSLTYFFSGDATMSDEASYSSDEDSFRATLGYYIEDKYLVSFEYMNMDNFTNSNPANSNFRLYLEEMLALSLSFPIDIL
ncbi:MAG: hypothetical protein NXH75_00380 [Halobacteriovoraceae bacterium]|nr:hypothetical protein [Halobacteriovoraceae bacterium]